MILGTTYNTNTPHSDIRFALLNVFNRVLNVILGTTYNTTVFLQRKSEEKEKYYSVQVVYEQSGFLGGRGQFFSD